MPITDSPAKIRILLVLAKAPRKIAIKPSPRRGPNRQPHTKTRDSPKYPADRQPPMPRPQQQQQQYTQTTAAIHTAIWRTPKPKPEEIKKIHPTKNICIFRKWNSLAPKNSY